MTTKEPLISIIMPAYNSEKYIRNAIKSVLDQTYNNWELLIIDDGSKDNTFKIINHMESKDSRIRSQQNKENMGVSSSRNKGIELSSGEWIAFLDSDDMWNPNKLERQVSVAREKTVDFLFTGSSYIDEEGKKFNGVFNVYEWVPYKKLRHQNIISCSSVLIKKEFFKHIKMENDNMHEDYATWLRILKSGAIAYGINEPLITYRISKNSKSGNKFKTFKMTYKVFRFVGENRPQSVLYTLSHILGSIKKYHYILNK